MSGRDVRAPAEAAIGHAWLQAEPLDVGTSVADLSRRAAENGTPGAVVSFTGHVRRDDGVTAIEFESYPEMAAAELARIRDGLVRAHAADGLVGLDIVHRVGTVRVGDAIVLVVAAARHRATAFAVAAEAMDVLKHRAPLWKREHLEDGTSRWVGAEPAGLPAGVQEDRSK